MHGMILYLFLVAWCSAENGENKVYNNEGRIKSCKWLSGTQLGFFLAKIKQFYTRNNSSLDNEWMF